MRHADSPGRPGPADRPGAHDRADDAAVSRVTAALRAEAVRHTPDSAAMLTRIEDAMMVGTRRSSRHARPRQKRPGPWRTPLRAVAAACAVLVAAAGVWLVAGPLWPHPTQTSPRAGSTTRNIPRATAGADGGGAVDGRSATPTSFPPSPASASPTATVILGSPGHTRVQQGFLWSDGSIDKNSTTSGSQSDVTLKNTKTVTALTVVLRLADTPGLKNTGAWSTAPSADTVIRVTHGNGMLVYAFTLRAGAMLAPGTYEFAGQYSHAPGGRNADYDTYLATASAGQVSVEVYGNDFPDS
jgi:hypothetical protein